MEKLKPNPTQEQIVLELLENAKGAWFDGMNFLRLAKPITQYHARIWELERRGYKIEGRFKEGKNWKEYRLIVEPKLETPKADIKYFQKTLFNTQRFYV